jgi:hypothetical protein
LLWRGLLAIAILFAGHLLLAVLSALMSALGGGKFATC